VFAFVLGESSGKGLNYAGFKAIIPEDLGKEEIP